MSHYRAPGLPPPAAPAPQPNTYLQPSGPPQAMPSPTPPPPETTPPQARDLDPHDGTLLGEWRAHHGSDWIRADGLHPTVRRMIDDRERVPAIRQRLRQLASSCPELETKITGNRAKRVVLYRVTEIEAA